jgi:hypothetical protein
MVKDRFPSDDRIPLFLSNLAEEPGQSGVRKVISSEVFRKAVLVFAAAAVLFAIVSVGNVILFASVTASEVSTPAPVDGNGHSTPAIQSTATAEDLPGTPPHDELLAAFKSALKNKAEDQPAEDQPKAEALLSQFQVWAAEEDAQTPARPLQPVQDVGTHTVHIPLPKRRPIQLEQTARAQEPLPQNAQSLMRRYGWRN